MHKLIFLLDTATDYVSFGLAIYAIGAMLATIWMQRGRRSMSAAATMDILHAGSCVIALVLLEATRRFWDGLHNEHFSFWITRLAFPVVYAVLGNSTFRLTNVDTDNPPELVPTSEVGCSSQQSSAVS
jgi:hypothetical protein